MIMSTRFSHRTTLSVCKPASFWREKRDTVIILLQVKNTAAVLAFFNLQKGSKLPAIRITEQPILLTKSKINCMGYKFSRYFH